jgi:hypothetical protein
VLAGGLVAGALDITYACVFWAIKAGVPAQRIFQSWSHPEGSEGGHELTRDPGRRVALSR